MGFRSGAYATVWETNVISEAMTKARISTSKKDKSTGKYETDFSGFVVFVGATNAKAAAYLKEKDRIKLGDIDVTQKYNKDTKTSYTNFVIFNFESYSNKADPDPAESAQDKVEDVISDGGLPF